MKKILTIAGSDSSGGAGIQADIKTVTAHKMYAESVICALTAQNTMGVFGIEEVPSDFVGAQLDAVFEDIYPDAIKIGMVSNSEIIKVIADRLIKYKAKNIVVDTVMVSTSGSPLISDGAREALCEYLIPLCDVMTPNLPEAEVLSGTSIQSKNGMICAAEVIYEKYKKPILLKGGHLTRDADDLLYKNGEEKWFSAKRINNPNTHGTGCTLSSAIACGLAEGKSLEDSVSSAKAYLTEALADMLDLGRGSGPVNHMVR